MDMNWSFLSLSNSREAVLNLISGVLESLRVEHKIEKRFRFSGRNLDQIRDFTYLARKEQGSFLETGTPVLVCTYSTKKYKDDENDVENTKDIKKENKKNDINEMIYENEMNENPKRHWIDMLIAANTQTESVEYANVQINLNSLEGETDVCHFRFTYYRIAFKSC